MTLTKEVTNALKYLMKSDEDFSEIIEWSIREKLALASAVIETGQEYWPSISRLIQSFGSNCRNDDKMWCSSKECAKQYSKLIDNIEKKKRSDINNSSLPLKELIVKKLTVERIEELQEDIRGEQEKQSALKNLLNDLQSGNLDDSILEIWNQLKENKDFIQFVTTTNEPHIKEKMIEKELESETTDAMTSSCVEDFSNSDNDEKPRLLLHLKKTVKRSSENDDDSSSINAKSPKIDSDKDSCDSCETEPAIYISNLHLDELPPEKNESFVKEIIDDLSKETKCQSQNNITAPNSSAWIKRSKMIIGNVIDDPNAHLFDNVALSKKDVNYKKIVKRIMNLIDIRNKLRDNLYSCPEEFEHDLLLVICNAVMYYPLGSPSNKIVRNIYDNILPLLQCLYEPENDALSSADSTIRRRTRKCNSHN